MCRDGPGGGSGDGGGGVFVGPDFLAGVGVEAGGDFFGAGAAGDEEFSFDEGGSGIAGTNGDFPFGGEFLGPGGGGFEIGDLGVAIGAHPLGPVIGACRGGGEKDGAGEQHDGVFCGMWHDGPFKKKNRRNER